MSADHSNYQMILQAVVNLAKACNLARIAFHALVTLHHTGVPGPGLAHCGSVADKQAVSVTVYADAE